MNKYNEDPAKLFCEQHWNEVFGESSSIENYNMSYIVVSNFIPLVLIAVLYIIIYPKLKSQEIPGEKLANAGQQRQQRERNVLKMTIAIVLGLQYAGCHALYCLFSSLRTALYGRIVASHTFHVLSD